MSLAATKISLQVRSVLVVGAGGLGLPVVHTLLRATHARVTVWDPDTLEISNLHRQVLYAGVHAGHPKVDALRAATLRDLPEAAERLQTERRRLDPRSVDPAFGSFDLVVEGSDDPEAKLLVNDAAQRRGRTALIGGLSRWTGAIFLVGRGRGGCMRCLYEGAPAPGAFQTCAAGGILGPLAGLVGGLLGWQAAALALGGPAPSRNRILQVEPRAAGTRGRPLPRRPGCPACASARPDRHAGAESASLPPASPTFRGQRFS